MENWPLAPLLPLLLLTFFSLLSLSLSRDNITIGSPLVYPDTLVSSGSIFTLGFFNISNSSSWYLGIWYTEITPQTVVWVANREKPMPNPKGILYISNDSSNLQLITNSSDAFWSTSPSSMVSPIAQLLDTGNFRLMEKNTNKTAWQSFDNPTDTLLPGMTFGWLAGQNQNLTSWTGSDNPAPSNYTIKLVQSEWPEIIISNGLKPIFRTGPLDGNRFTGSPQFDNYTDLTFEYVSNQNESYIKMTGPSKSRFVLNQSTFQLYIFDEEDDDPDWDLQWSVPDPKDPCDNYAKCGQFGMCNLNSPNNSNCTCLTGFVPTREFDWDESETSSGCKRQFELNCTSDGFLQISNVKLPDTTNITTVDSTIELKECKKRCLKNCSCYAYSNSKGRRGCTMWMGNLTDMRILNNGGWTLYYRVAGSSLHATNNLAKKKKTAIIVTSAILGLLILASVAYLVQKKLKKQTGMFEISVATLSLASY